MTAFNTLLRDIEKFIKKPSLDPEQPLGFKQQLSWLFKLLAIDYALMLVTLIPISFLVQEDMVSEHRMDEFIELASPVIIFLSVVVAAPLIEETAFRLYLSGQPPALFISLILMGFYFLMPLPSPTLYYATALYGGSLCILLAFLVFNTNSPARLEKFWKHNFRWIYYFSALLFGLVHLLNYELARPSLWLLAPILVLPQILLGLLLGYVRIRQGFFLAIALHALHNLILIVILLVMRYNGVDINSF
ncbi:MAG: CPBP family intramembrane metalloprotease [Bacteroidia bacterium]|nr:CPBP family intramembrane metalloprotease [Bacteroidia bacterium]